MISRAKRLEEVRGFGIDRGAAAADRPAEAPDWRVLRMENLDTDLPLPPEAVAATAAGLETPEANSWLPFTGDPDLRAAISDFTAERTGHRYDPEREIVITVGGMEGLLNALLATVDHGDEIVVTDPTYAGIVNRVHLAGGTPIFVPFRGRQRVAPRPRRARARSRTRRRAMLLMSPSMPSGGTFTRRTGAGLRPLPRARPLPRSTTPPWSASSTTGARSCIRSTSTGMAERTSRRRLALEGAPHDRLARRLGGGPGRRRSSTSAGRTSTTRRRRFRSRARAAAAVLRGDQDHVADCVAELERRRDVMLDGLPGLAVRQARRRLVDAARRLGARLLGPRASRILLDEAAIAATAMVGWGGPVAEKYVRFVYSAEPVERFAGSRNGSRRVPYDAETGRAPLGGRDVLHRSGEVPQWPSGSMAV